MFKDSLEDINKNVIVDLEEESSSSGETTIFCQLNSIKSDSQTIKYLFSIQSNNYESIDRSTSYKKLKIILKSVTILEPWKYMNIYGLTILYKFK